MRFTPSRYFNYGGVKSTVRARIFPANFGFNFLSITRHAWQAFNQVCALSTCCSTMFSGLPRQTHFQSFFFHFGVHICASQSFHGNVCITIYTESSYAFVSGQSDILLGK